MKVGRIRSGGYYRDYSWMAMVSYADAKRHLDLLLKGEGQPDEILLMEDMLEREVMVTIVFSAMALESFANDFVAGECGDEFFLQEVKWWDTVKKIKWIRKNILGGELNNEEGLFSLIKALFRCRNLYVHNESKDVSKEMFQNAMTDDEISKMSDLSEEENMAIYTISESKKRGLKEDIEVAHAAIDAIYGVAEFFERHEKGEGAMSLLFGAGRCGTYSKEEAQKVIQVQKEFGVPEIIF